MGVGLVGARGACERIEVFLKIQKKMGGRGVEGRCWVGGGGSGWGVRVDVNEELKFLGNSQKKMGGGREGVSWGGRVGGGVRVDVNAMLGVGGDVGYGGYDPRIEGIVQCTKRYCTILRKSKNVGGGEGEGQYLNPKHSLCI